ncbi:MAG TPA: asparagine synthase (glutamine-hydrolyzing) [Chitinophagales bacterium]|jgi:asparagine synthase (glutamine-hydrolysing)|nr:asparagine synthase (glutamine-hydrolyzing) [Chitinophagales bacterium]
MCGVVGFHRKDAKEKLDQLIIDGLDSIKHRGPDNSEYWNNNYIYFGHTRLKILDLSDQANQPFCFENLILSFNGEIYNYIELRGQLKKQGYKFLTNSDTEVIIKAYHYWGNDCFEKLDGMFALAVYDTLQNTIVLARDVFGKKPMYFSKMEGLAFCSELKAFKFFFNDLKVSNEALNHFLSIGYVIEPLTLYENVYALPPSSYLVYEIDSQRSTQYKYYSYEDCFRVKTQLNHLDIVHQTRELLNKAIEKRLMGDVPMGMFLSGGIDSSGIVASIQKNFQNQFPCFTVGFNSSNTYNEFFQATELTELLNLPHFKIDLSQIQLEDFQNYLNLSDYHTFDNSSYPIYKLSELARQSVKFVLTGDGSDEVFGGYSTYIADEINSKISILIPFIQSLNTSSFISKLVAKQNDKVGWRTKASRFTIGMNKDYRLAHYKWRELFNEEKRILILGSKYRELVYDTCPSKQFLKMYENVSDLERKDQHLFVDTYTWLSCNNLVKIDRNTMRAGLEARSPFLDKDLTAFIASCPIQYKKQKNLLKEALSPYLSKNILSRKKAGFNSPVSNWFNTSENEFEFYTKMIFEHIISNND